MDVIVLSEHDSDNSIVEVEVPKKASPPLVQIDEDDILIHVNENVNTHTMMGSVQGEPSAVVEISKPLQDNFKEPELWHRRVDVSRMISPKHWTSDMIRFYNEDWGNENYFSVENLQRGMDRRPYLWQIAQRDWVALQRARMPFIYCRNCNRSGHTADHCTEQRTPKCHMCGVEGHISSQCPNAICLSCGNKTHNYHVGCTRCALRKGRICSRCSMKGHNLVECPDHWRLYHLTLTTDQVVVPPTNIYKNEAEMWCCNCGRKGHHHYHCNQPKSNDGYGLTVPYVMSYERVFYNQLQPQENIDIQLTSKEQKKIKKAVRLLNLKQLSKPRDLSAPKKEFSQKAIEKFKNRKFKYGHAWVKKFKKKQKKKKEKQKILKMDPGI